MLVLALVLGVGAALRSMVPRVDSLTLAARARFEEVHEQVADLGLATAFRAGDLYFAERSGEPEEAARAYDAATQLRGAPELERPMPSFELIDVDTHQGVRSQDLLGTPYLLELWSTWCKPCLEQMEALHELHAELGPRLRIISVAAFRAKHWPMPWTNVWVPGGDAVFEAWSITSVPYAVLVGADGIVQRVGADVNLDDVRAAAE